MVEFEIEKTVPTSSSSNAKWLWRWAWCTLPKSETDKLTSGVSPIFPHWLPSRVEGQLTSIIGFTTEDQDFFSCSGICRIGLPKIMWKSHVVNSGCLRVLAKSRPLSGNWLAVSVKWLLTATLIASKPCWKRFPSLAKVAGSLWWQDHGQSPRTILVVPGTIKHNPTQEAGLRLKLGTAWILGAASWPRNFVNIRPFIWQPSESKNQIKYQPSTRLDSSFKSIHYITIYSPHLLDWFWFLPTFFTLLFASSLQHRQLEVDSVPLNPPTSKADVFADFSAKRWAWKKRRNDSNAKKNWQQLSDLPQFCQYPDPFIFWVFHACWSLPFAVVLPWLFSRPSPFLLPAVPQSSQPPHSVGVSLCRHQQTSIFKQTHLHPVLLERK